MYAAEQLFCSMLRIVTSCNNANVMRSLAIAALTVAGFVSPALAADAGQAAPPFSLPSRSGEPTSLDKLRGKVVYVDFWASWCGPCRRSFPWMNDMQQKYGSKGFVVVGVNVDKKRADADKFLAQNPASFTIVFDESGATPSAYAVKGMPSSYLIDGNGNVIYVERGFVDEHKAGLEQRIAALVGKGQ
jgi:thiol-disulfide isomerase/thioredoxin